MESELVSHLYSVNSHFVETQSESFERERERERERESNLSLLSLD